MAQMVLLIVHMEIIHMAQMDLHIVSMEIMGMDLMVLHIVLMVIILMAQMELHIVHMATTHMAQMVLHIVVMGTQYMEDKTESTNQKIGWCFDRDEGVAIYKPPILLSKLITSRGNIMGAGVSHCPGVRDLNSRTFSILSPYTFRIRAKRIDNQLNFYPVYPDTEASEEVIKREISFQARKLWRDDKYPILQLSLPYVFFSNESVYINQIEPNRFKGEKNWSLIQGRFDIASWQRPINWGIEWIDTEKDICIKKGDPLCQIIFETTSPESDISLIKVERNEELQRAIKRTIGIVNKIRNTKNLIYDKDFRLNISELK